MHQGIQGKEVTFKDVLILFFKRFERIFIVALAFAVVFAAYGAMRGYRAISSENRNLNTIITHQFKNLFEIFFVFTI